MSSTHYTGQILSYFKRTGIAMPSDGWESRGQMPSGETMPSNDTTMGLCLWNF